MKTSTTVALALATAVLAALVHQLLPSGEVAGMATPDRAQILTKDPAAPPAVSRSSLATARPAQGAEDPQYLLPASAIATGDKAEPFGPKPSRFWKVPRNLVSIYEEASRDYRIPVRYLAANGSWESLFDSKLMGDGNRSCGIHQFHHTKTRNGTRDWTAWGFASLEECQDPRANIRMAARTWRARIDNTDPNAHCNGLLSCAIRLHKGWGANSYMRAIMSGADRYYRSE